MSKGIFNEKSLIRFSVFLLILAFALLTAFLISSVALADGNKKCLI